MATYRGTTPKHIFYFPFLQNQVDVLKISYFQKGHVIFTKELSDVVFNPAEETIELQLSQADTLSFEKFNRLDRTRDSLILIQIRLLLKNGEAWVSEVMKERLGDVLLDGELTPTNPNGGQLFV